MKILYIDVNCKGSSTGQIVYSLFSNCKKNGIEAAVCYGRGPLIKEEGIYKFGLDWETLFHAFMTRITGYTGCFSYFSTIRLIKYIKKFKPDVVHIHELHAYFVNIKQLLTFLKNSGIKTVVTNHCEFLFTGKCGVAFPCEKYKTGCGKCPKNNIYPKSILFDKTKKMYKQKKMLFESISSHDLVLTAPSNFLVKRVKESFLSKFEIDRVYNCIDTSFFCLKTFNTELFKEKFGLPDNKKIVLFVAPNAMTQLKGGNHFVALSNRIQQDDYFFVLIGANQNDRRANLLMIDRVDNKETLSCFYNIAYCTVILSSYESFSMVSIESQCCGSPVMYFNVGGISETIVKDEYGIKVDYGDVENIVCNLQSNCFDGINRKQLSQLAVEKYNNNKMFDSYYSIYEDLLKP